MYILKIDFPCRIPTHTQYIVATVDRGPVTILSTRPSALQPAIKVGLLRSFRTHSSRRFACLPRTLVTWQNFIIIVFITAYATVACVIMFVVLSESISSWLWEDIWDWILENPALSEKNNFLVTYTKKMTLTRSQKLHIIETSLWSAINNNCVFGVLIKV